MFCWTIYPGFTCGCWLLSEGTVVELIVGMVEAYWRPGIVILAVLANYWSNFAIKNLKAATKASFVNVYLAGSKLTKETKSLKVVKSKAVRLYLCATCLTLSTLISSKVEALEVDALGNRESKARSTLPSFNSSFF